LSAIAQVTFENLCSPVLDLRASAAVLWRPGIYRANRHYRANVAPVLKRT